MYHLQTRLQLSALLGTAFLISCGTQLESHVVQMDDRAVEIVSAGSGAATVVFESGLGDDWQPWDTVASEVALSARVVAYSRPGYGRSLAVSTPRDAAQIVGELRVLLRAQGYQPPYVLVGHSFGGTYMELFAKQHPEEVAGLVLVDPRHRDFTTVCEREDLKGCGIPASALTQLPQVQIEEYEAFANASAEIAAAGGFGEYPVRVLTATEHSSSSSWEALWRSMLGLLAAEAPLGEQIIYKGAAHYLQLERSQEVAQQIVELVAVTD